MYMYSSDNNRHKWATLVRSGPSSKKYVNSLDENDALDLSSSKHVGLASDT